MARTFSVFGDSISTFEGCTHEGFAVFYNKANCERAGITSIEDTWWMRVIRAFDGQLLANAAWSGSMLEGAGYPCGNCNERVAALSEGDASPDDILVYYGINDYGWGGPDAQARGRGSAMPRCLIQAGLPDPIEAGNAPVNAAQGFGRAYGQMIDRMKSRFPKARIWCFTMLPGRVKYHAKSTFPYNYRGVAFSAYNQAIIDAAESHGAIAVDIASMGYDYDSIEGTHPTKLGMRQMADMMVLGMKSASSAFHKPSDSELAAAHVDLRGFESSDPCPYPGRSCVGCAHALSTGNSWMHVCQLSE